jgi:hypothetical protein
MMEGGGTPEDPIDLTKEDSDDEDINKDDRSKQDKGKGKADPKEDNETQDDPSLLEYFYKLLEKRDELISQYEEASRVYNVSETEENKLRHDQLANQLDEIENDIDAMKDHGFLDPADDIQSEDENE